MAILGNFGIIFTNVIFTYDDNPNNSTLRVVAVAQLVEQTIPTPEVCSLNLTTGKNYDEQVYLLYYLQKRRKYTKKWPEMAHFSENNSTLTAYSLWYLVYY